MDKSGTKTWRKWWWSVWCSLYPPPRARSGVIGAFSPRTLIVGENQLQKRPKTITDAPRNNNNRTIPYTVLNHIGYMYHTLSVNPTCELFVRHKGQTKTSIALEVREAEISKKRFLELPGIRGRGVKDRTAALWPVSSTLPYSCLRYGVFSWDIRSNYISYYCGGSYHRYSYSYCRESSLLLWQPL